MRAEEYRYNCAIATENEPLAGAGAPAGQERNGKQLAPAGLQREALKLLSFGIGKPLLEKMIAAAVKNGTRLENELIASGSIAENIYYEALARELDLAFVAAPEGSRVQDIAGIDSQLICLNMIRVTHPWQSAVTAIVPRLDRMDALGALL